MWLIRPNKKTTTTFEVDDNRHIVDAESDQHSNHNGATYRSFAFSNGTSHDDDEEDLNDQVEKSTKKKGRQQDDADGEILAKNETQNVKRSRIIVAIVLVSAALVISLTVYFYIRNSEQTNFMQGYQSDTETIWNGMGMSIQGSLAAMQSFGTTMVNHAQSTNQTFPFVTMSNFPVQASRMMSLTSAIQWSIQMVISAEQRLAWEDYSVQHADWVNETKRVQTIDQFFYANVSYGQPIPGQIWDFDGIRPNETHYYPQWQNYPTLDPAFNYDLLSATVNTTPYDACVYNHVATFSPPYNVPDPNDAAAVKEKEFWTYVFEQFLGPSDGAGEPGSDFWYPVTENMATIDIFETNLNDYPVVATVDAISNWRDFIRNLLPITSHGIMVYFENACAGAFTYKVSGPNVTFLGQGDHHETKYNRYKLSKHLNETIQFYRYSGVPLDSVYCPYRIDIYPSAEYESIYTTNYAIALPICIILAFAFVSMVFFIYDINVERRQKIVLNTAEKTSHIVSSLFPSVVRDQILNNDGGKSLSSSHPMTTMEKYKNSIKYGGGLSTSSLSPIAQNAMASLYPDTTVLFADLAGFTAWSSSRTPSQVFVLLETLYGVFDRLATRRRVFKVETIGDCYVAATGLPDPMKNHAVVMSRFAFECLNKTSELTSQLVATLGIETADLRLRVGINSGPTTAGVLRGDKARFQLFGDTVNTASRMESTGVPGRIQVSQKTADLLIAAGKESWLMQRSDVVEAKGKGSMITYWLYMTGPSSAATSTADGQLPILDWTDDTIMASKEAAGTVNRLVEWNFSVFNKLLQQVVATRSISTDLNLEATDEIVPSCRPLDEMSETLETKMCDKQSMEGDPNQKLDENVALQLRDLIMTIGHLYKPNPFHNFEHASHVVMSTMKLLDTICFLHEDATSANNESDINEAKHLYLDPLTQFGIAFAALIHDVDHMGMTNRQMIEEKLPIAELYHNKSVAEQNSIEVAWELFMQPTFDKLRQCMFACSNDLKRFRQVVVNSVLATDLFDKDLISFRENRWNQVFSNHSSSTSVSSETDERNRNLKNAIIIEHLVQASDVVHTMQHWEVYQKWNKQLFVEMYGAYQNGHSNESPANGWYAGELLFFENYIIPLAKRLYTCGVFGVSCDELLNYAIDNRSEWERKGNSIVYEWENEIKQMQDPEEY